jgi:O-antigen ligase
VNLNGVFTSFIGVNAPFSPLLLLLGILYVFISKVHYTEVNIGFKIISLFLFGFLFFGTIAFLINYQIHEIPLIKIWEESRAILTSYLLITVFYLHGIQLRDRKKIDTFLLHIGIIFFITQMGGILESVLGLKNNFYGKMQNIVGGERTLGFFGNPNETGLQANLTLILGFYLFLNKKIPLLVLFLFIGTSITAAIYSFSKMAMIISGINIVFFFSYLGVASFKLSRLVRFRIVSLLVLSFIFVTFVLIPYSINFYNNLEDSQKIRIDNTIALVVERRLDNETTSNRTGVAMEAIELIRKNPVIGYGLRTFGYGHLFSVQYGVHNNYLKVYGEAGIVAFLLFLLLIFHLIYAAFFKVSPPDSYIILAFIGTFMVVSMASHTTLSRKFIMPLFGLLYVLIQYNSKTWLTK